MNGVALQLLRLFFVAIQKTFVRGSIPICFRHRTVQLSHGAAKNLLHRFFRPKRHTERTAHFANIHKVWHLPLLYPQKTEQINFPDCFNQE